ncbi:ABC transporter permease [Prolixibacteraceae bacterium JC049]|nr:ABC transporter permease [Prolixibacteraceae bacterium JC049]
MVNIISAIAMVGVLVSSAALLIVLSAMNGIEEVTMNAVAAFDPELKITAAEGKSFTIDRDARFEQIKKMDEVAFFSESYEDNALVRFEDRKTVTRVKGVDEQFQEMTSLDSLIVDGKFVLNEKQFRFALLGAYVANSLSYRTRFVNPLHLYVPKKGAKRSISGMPQLNNDYIFPSGIFEIQSEKYAQYILVPLDFARSLFEAENKVTSIEIKLKKWADLSDVKKSMHKILGDEFKVRDFKEQNKLTYSTFKLERLMIMLILGMIMLIAALNIISSLSMLIMDKQSDIETLKSMGATVGTIKKIFLLEGWLIAIFGAIGGLVLGSLLVYLQHKFGIIKLPGNGLTIPIAYPMQFRLFDLLKVAAMVLGIGFITAWYPVRYISGRYLKF